MRLTLRTMLAYLDGILDPEDAQDIAKKIQESEYATKLMHRTRDVVRRLRLSAPALTDRGPGLDANTVAEYLDNTLSDDRVPDFEKVCLDSDIHLAEVAACHQILTLVLGEPAEIDPAARQRMYQLPQQLATLPPVESLPQPSLPEPVLAAAAARQPDGQQDVSVAARARQRPTVPDYLRDPPGNRRFLPVAAALLLVACLTALVLVELGQFAPGTFLGDLVGKITGRELAENELTDGTSGGTSGGDSGAERRPPEGPFSPKPGPAAKSPEVGPPAETPEEPTPIPPGKKEEPEAPKVEKPGKPEGPPSGEEPAPTGKTPPEKAGAESSTSLPKEPGGPETVVKPTPEPPEAVAQSVGRFTSEKQVMLRFDPTTADWRRIPTQAIVSSADRFFVLPTYESTITLTAGVTVQLMPGTEVELLPPAGPGEGIPGLRIVSGRLVARTVGKSNVQLQLQVNGHNGVVTFEDAKAIVAVEVVRSRVPGTNPETEPVVAVAKLWVTGEGSALWREGADRQPVALKGQMLTLDDDPDPRPLVARQPPIWMKAEALGFWDSQASPALEQLLSLDASASDALKNLTGYRRKEVSWLAARCLSYLGQFDAMVALLNDDDKDRRQLWPECIERLQESLAQGPETAARLRKALEKQYALGPGDELYRMLWGYTEKDLKTGEAKTLVNDLSHKVLAFRVVSFWNLQKLTGWKLYYTPDQPEAKRLPGVQAWKKRLDSGELMMRVAEKLARRVGGETSPPGEPADQ